MGIRYFVFKAMIRNKKEPKIINQAFELFRLLKA